MMIPDSRCWARSSVPVSIATLAIAIPLVLGPLSPQALAWERHQSFMDRILSHPPDALQKAISAPCGPEDLQTAAKLTEELRLNRSILFAPTAPLTCAKGTPLTGVMILNGVVTDEPDNGMDQDLDASADPKGERKYMGGEKGPNSQGFRHMHFGGWKPGRPLATLQYPFNAVGQALERTQETALLARAMLREKKEAWGYRVLGWSVHYLQDLTQPFHTTQIPSLKMLPWERIDWAKPGLIWGTLVEGTTQSISNYHRAYEEYVATKMKALDPSFVAECLKPYESGERLGFQPKTDPVRKLIETAAGRSRARASEIGQAVYEFFGPELKRRDVDIALGRGRPDYADMAIRPDLVHQRARLESLTCEALKDTATASRALIEWAITN